MPIILNASALGPETWTSLAGYTLTKQKNAPTISFISPIEGQEFTTSSITVNGTASDYTENINVTVKVGGVTQGLTVTGSPTWTWTIYPIQLAEGSNNITAIAIDASNNYDQATVNVIYTPPDTENPIISFISPTEGQEFTTSPITVNGSASDNKGLSKVEVKVGAGSWVTVTGGSSWTYSSMPLAEGWNIITARATDTSDNSNQTSVNVRYTPLDTEKPSISIISPTEGQVFTTSSITVNGTASDNVALSKVEVKVGAGLWLPVTGTSSWNVSSITLTEGKNNITARATDNSNNYNQTSVNVTFTPPDTTNPAISIISPTEGQVFTTSPITVNGTASDNVALSKVEVKVGAGLWLPVTGTSSWNISSITLTEGTNKITARATDTSDNYSETSVNVTYAQQGITNPDISITSPTDGDEFNTSSIEVSGTVLNNSTFRMVEVKVNNGSWENASGADPWNITVQLSIGSNTIYARANYTTSNSNNASITVTYNGGDGHTSRRSISITSPTEGQVVNTSSITVNGTIPDNVTLSKVEVKVGAGQWFTATTSNVSWTVSSITLLIGTNNITARATDTSNNYTETSVNVTYTPLSITNPPSRNSGGGGGGGGGGGSGEQYSNIDVNEKYDLPIYKDRMTSYSFKSVKNPIIYLNITGNTNNDVITATVEALKGTSSLVTSAAPGNVYRNVNVWVGTSGFATPKNIKEAMIRFRVENSWITPNDDIKLLRWDGSNWITLKTSEINKDDTFTYFEANTEGFSSFAITSLKDSLTLESIFSTEKTPAEKGAKTGGNKTKGNKPESDKSNLLVNWFIIGGIFVLVGFIIEVLKMKKK